MFAVIAGIFIVLGIGILIAHALDAFRSVPRSLARPIRESAVFDPIDVAAHLL